MTIVTPTSKLPNPRTPPLGRFLRSLESHVTHGYVTLRNGQIVRDDTWKRWGVGLRSERATRRAVRHGHLDRLPEYTDLRPSKSPKVRTSNAQ